MCATQKVHDLFLAMQTLISLQQLLVQSQEHLLMQTTLYIRKHKPFFQFFLLKRLPDCHPTSDSVSRMITATPMLEDW